MNIVWLFVVAVIAPSLAENLSNCRVSYKFEKICHRFRIDDLCQPPKNVASCERIKTSYNDRKCPSYFCVLKSSNRPKSSALSITTRSTALDLLTTTTRFLVDEKNLVSPKTHSDQTDSRSKNDDIKRKSSSPKKITTTRKPKTTTRTPTTARTTEKKAQTKSREKARTSRPTTTTATRPTTTTSRATRTTTSRLKTTTKPTTLRPTTSRPTTSSQTTLRSVFTLPKNPTTLRSIFTLPKYPITDKPDESQTTITTLAFTTTSTTAHPITTSTTARPLSRKTTISRRETTKKEIKVYQLFKPVKDLSKKMTSTDCGDKICFLRHQFLKDCYLFLHTNKTDCKIPCHLEGCKKELHHFMSCPIWECNASTTTTTVTSTSTTATTTYETTTTTEPMPMPSSSTSMLYISIAVNLAFILVGLIFFAYKKYCQRAPYQPIQEEQPLRRRISLLSNDNRFFSVGSESESNPETNEHGNMADMAESNYSGNTGAIPKHTTKFETVNLQSPTVNLESPTTSLHYHHDNCPLTRYSNYSTFSTFKPTISKPDNEIEN